MSAIPVSRCMNHVLNKMFVAFLHFAEFLPRLAQSAGRVEGAQLVDVLAGRVHGLELQQLVDEVGLGHGGLKREKLVDKLAAWAATACW